MNNKIWYRNTELSPVLTCCSDLQVAGRSVYLYVRLIECLEVIEPPLGTTCRERAVTLHSILIPWPKGAALEPFEERVG